MTNLKFFLIPIFFLTCIVAAISFSWFERTRHVPVCERAAIGLDDTVPIILAAILDEACALEHRERDPSTFPDAFVDFGYPSVLLEEVPQDQALELFYQVVDAGERDFFARDAKIVNLLSSAEYAAKFSTFLDFTVASQPNLWSTYEPQSEAEFLRALPIFQDEDGREFFTKACENFACDQDMTICPQQLGLSDKLALALGHASLVNVIGQCGELTDYQRFFEWYPALRRAGVVDTKCSLTLQINDASIDPMNLTRACFSDGRQLGDYSAFTNGDIVAFVRGVVGAGNSVPLAADTLMAIEKYSPDLAAYLTAE